MMKWVNGDLGRGCPGRGFVAWGLALLAGLCSLESGALAQDFGYEGPSFSGAGSRPTESKPESKLWFHDGAWWGSLWSTTAQAFHIHRLDQSTHLWTDTGVPIEFRPQSKSDVLCEGNKLYVGSHRFSSDGGASGNLILVLRYSYDPLAESYALDPGFPVTIGSFSTESLVIDKDSTGTVWAAWVQGLRVFASHTVGGDDLIWTAPAILPGSNSDLTTDEVCALTHFGGNRIGVMWSDQVQNLFPFAVHQDGDPDDVWSLETALSGESDDHINLATDATGRVFATVKNAADEIKLLVRDAGNWTSFLVSNGVDRFTRPTLLLDEQRRRIHVFANGQDNGLIHEKTSSLDNIAFVAGTGTVVMRDASNPLVNDLTSTKQNIDSSTGLVVLAAHETTEAYWHHSVAPAALLVASFSAAPLAGRAPLSVQFTDISTGTPTSWAWDFGDGDTASVQNPTHVYTATGTFPVRLTVNAAGGSDEELWSDLISVTPASQTQSFPALADSRVSEATPGSNAGTAADLRVRFAAGGSVASYLRFDLSGLAGPLVAAKLRLFCTDGSTVGGLVFPTHSAWTEAGITWSNAPASTGGQIAALGSVSANTWVEFDVTPAVGAPGLVNFLLTSTTSNSAIFSSREGAQPPELVVELAGVPPTAADFSATPTTGAAPLSVAFTDISSGGPTSWSWDFGDGASSTVQNPVHVYTSPGSFSVALTVTGPGGADGETKTNLISVATLPPIQTLLPVADARVNQGTPNANAGSATVLRVRFAAGNSYHSYLRFDLSGLGGAVTSAKLRLFCSDGSNAGGRLFPTSSSWAENAISWNNKPAATGAQIAGFGVVAAGTWAEVDVTSAVGGSGPINFLLTSTSSDNALYSSREGANPPQLVVETGPPQPPAADFSASPTTGVAPLSVAFTDLTSNNPTSWSWDFGDGTSSSARNPLHVYGSAGIFSVTLTAASALGSSVIQRTDLVSVTALPPIQTLLPVADARVNQASPNTNAGRSPDLRVQLAAGGSFHSYVRFDLSGLSGPPTSAKLRLSCKEGSNAGGLLFPTSSSWNESAITWNNKPAASGPQIAALGAVTTGTWVEVDVTSVLGAPGPVSFLLTNSSSDSALFSSREGTQPPQLVVETGTP